MLAAFVQPGPSVHLQDNLKVTSFTPIALFYTDTPPSRDHEGLVQGLITLLYSAVSPFPPRAHKAKNLAVKKIFPCCPFRPFAACLEGSAVQCLVTNSGMGLKNTPSYLAPPFPTGTQDKKIAGETFYPTKPILGGFHSGRVCSYGTQDFPYIFSPSKPSFMNIVSG